MMEKLRNSKDELVSSSNLISEAFGPAEPFGASNFNCLSLDGTEERCFLVTPEGQWIELEIINRVPMFTDSNLTSSNQNSSPSCFDSVCVSEPDLEIDCQNLDGFENEINK